MVVLELSVILNQPHWKVNNMHIKAKHFLSIYLL